MNEQTEAVRCIECAYAGPPVNQVCRCRILRICKHGRTRRICQHYKARDEGKDKEDRDHKEPRRQSHDSGPLSGRDTRGERTRHHDGGSASDGPHLEATGDDL